MALRNQEDRSLWIPENPHWWQSGVIYQIYPRSFCDSNGDGVGDLNGIVSKVDYLRKLGIDAVWLSPVYTSPMVDFGYDVADYVGIDPVFGTMEDFDKLLKTCHEADIRLIMDFVPNHSSSKHPWFQESRKSRDSKKRHWYVWRDPKNGGLPNNWESYFGGSAWTLDEESGQYYLHSFHQEQPDLNWDNPEVANALGNVMRFWLAKGVDGFRVDVLWIMGKDPEFRDNLINPNWNPSMRYWQRQFKEYSEEWPTSHLRAQYLRSVIEEFDERVMVAEVVLPPERMVAYYGEGNEAHLPLNFSFVEIKEWSAPVLREAIQRYETLMKSNSWPNWFLGNHDFSRIGSRAGKELIPLLLTLLLTLRGTPTIYYGEELGMLDAIIPEGKSLDPQKRYTPSIDRDAARSPMIWNSEKGFGFTFGDPWLPFAPNAHEITVEEQTGKTGSVLELTRNLIKLRRKNPALAVGGLALGLPDSRILSYCRSHPAGDLLVLLNFTSENIQVDLPAKIENMIFSTQRDLDGSTEISFELYAFEGVIIRLRS